MMNMLNARDFTKLAEDLSLPLVVKHALDQKPEDDSMQSVGITDDTRMIMASFLADMRSDHLLLSLACTLRMIADHKSDDREIATSLYYHADFILDDYAPYWRHHGQTLFPAEWIVHIQEDLELMHEILCLTRDAFAYRDDVIYNICDILIEYTKAKIEDGFSQEQSSLSDVSLDLDIHYPSNVIAFPMDRISSPRR